MLRCTSKWSAVIVLVILTSLAWARQVSATSLTVGEGGYNLSATYNGTSFTAPIGNWTVSLAVRTWRTSTASI